MDTATIISNTFEKLGFSPSYFASAYSGLTSFKSSEGSGVTSYSPIDGTAIGKVNFATKDQYELILQQAQNAFIAWRKWPAPKRGEVIRQYGDLLRVHKEALGTLVTLEMGKSIQEGLGEVQEMIDICDFACGLSRQLYGLTIASERPEHRMMEQYHALGIVGIISAFNFPVAVWSWNAMLAAVCGDVCIWKPSEKTPFTAIACHYLMTQVMEKNQVPNGVFNLVLGDRELGEWMSTDKRIPLISATGSTRMGKQVAIKVAERLGKSLLELGGNNAIIVSEHANLDLAVRAIVFGSTGTCGQRCTSTRRIIVHAKVKNDLVQRLIKAYQSLTIGNPLDSKNLVGPLVDEHAQKAFLNAIKNCLQEGGQLLVGGDAIPTNGKGFYVKPAIVEAKNSFHSVQEETFAPILYLLTYTGDVHEAIAMQNESLYGLSSSIFTNNMQEAELFVAVTGSDCGIANVNIGTSGAEIGGAFGGEKDTGGGRESGSDAWKAYMRRQTNTLNYSNQLPLAQGINFNS
jgi:aldehyde dehydrogenase (NAD+)